MTLQVPEIVVHGIPSTLLYSRASRVTVGPVQISNIGKTTGLDVWFSVRRSLKPKEPNTCDLKIWNLADSTRHRIEQAAQPSTTIGAAPGASNTVVPVQIEAGYEGTMETIFLGEMRSAQTVRDGADFVTELQTGDGDEAAALARISQSLGPTDAYAVTIKLLTAMGSGHGNLPAFASVLRGSALYGGGVSLKGNPKTILIELARSVGLEFSVQNGQAQFLSLGQPIDGSGYLLSSDTGLIGEPSVDTKGVLACETLMLPGLRPGKLVSMNSLFVNSASQNTTTTDASAVNDYRVVSMVTVGDTAGVDWTHKIEGKRLGAPVSAPKKTRK